MENPEQNRETPEVTENKPKSFKRAIVLIVLVVSVIISLVILWMTDAPPIEDDYTIDDLRSAGPEYAESYNILLSLSEDPCSEGSLAIGLDAEDVNKLSRNRKEIRDTNILDIDTILRVNEEDIERLWEKSLKGRQIISRLDSYEEIADLSPLDLDADLSYLSNFRRLVQIYSCYSTLQLVRGNDLLAANILIQLDSVCRKTSINSRMMVNKLVDYSGIINNLTTANLIANHPKSTGKSIQILSDHFRPLTEEESSLRNAYISEYLIFSKYISPEKLLDFTSTISGNEQSPSKFKIHLFDKPNSSRRLYRNACDRWIAREESIKWDPSDSFSVWPRALRFFPEVHIRMESNEPWPVSYCLYNSIGYTLASILAPAIDTVYEVKIRTLIYDDLLQIVIKKRLGQPVDLTARAYSDEYIIDTDKKIIFSPGPDGISYTDDDIKFDINPDVLNLSSSGQEQ